MAAKQEGLPRPLLFALLEAHVAQILAFVPNRRLALLATEAA